MTEQLTRGQRRAIEIELAEIERRLRETHAALQLLLAMRILEDGHAKNLGEAVRIAKDLDRVRALYPDVFP